MNRWRRAMDLAWEAFQHPASSQDDLNVGVPGVPAKGDAPALCPTTIKSEKYNKDNNLSASNDLISSATVGVEHLEYGDIEERAAIVQFDGDLPPDDEELASPIRDTSESRPAIAAPTPEEIAADWSQAFGMPVKRVEGYQAMAGNNPGSILARRWSGLMVAVAVIFRRWARQTIALGWDELDLIGAHPRYPVQRIDHQGLCWFIGHDTELLALTNTAARFREPSGAVQSVSRKPIKEPGDARIWDLCKSRSE